MAVIREARHAGVRRIYHHSALYYLVLSIIATPKKETTLLLKIPLAPPSEEK